MTDYVWPADLAPFAQGFSLQPHTGGSESPFSRVSKIYGLSAPRWTAKLNLRAPENADVWGGDVAEWGERLDALLDQLKGRQNRILLWDFRREGAVAAFSNQAVNAGESVVYLNGAVLGDLRVGQYLGGDGRPHRVIDVRAGGPSPAGLTVAVEPPFGAYVAAGAVTAYRVAGLFRLTSDEQADVVSEVGQLTPYSLELVEDIDALGAAGVSFYDTFADTLNSDPLRRDAQYRSVYGYGLVPAKWRLMAGDQWKTDGNGYASPGTVEGDTQNQLHGCLLAPAGTAGDRRITVVLQGYGSNRAGVVVASDGRYFILFEWFGSGGNTFRIREGDMQAGSPTYSTSGGNSLTTIATSAAIPDFVNGVDDEYVIELQGTTLTATHTKSGTSVSGTVTVPIGPEFGILANNSSAKIKSIKVEPIGTPTSFDIGNGVKLIDGRVIDYMGDADGISMADRDGNGLPDIVIGNSSNQNKTVGGIYRFDQPVRDAFVRTPVDVNSSMAVTDRYTGVEGVCLVPIDDYRYVFLNDTPNVGQYLLDLTTGDRVLMSSYKNGQDCRILTIDGEMCIIATHEGGAGLSGIANGGIVGHRYLGGSPLDLASWQEFTIVRRKGAWGLQKSNFRFLDLDGDTVADELIFSARDGGANTDVTAPGVYSVKKPASPFTTEWTETALKVASDGDDLINIDVGDFSGDGNGLDIVYSILNQTSAPKYLRKSTGWTSTAMVTIGLASVNKLYNVMTMPVRGTGTRDGILAWTAYMGFHHVYWDGAAWQKKLVRGQRYDHGWNACNGATWSRGDSTYSVFLGNSFASSFAEMRFK